MKNIRVWIGIVTAVLAGALWAAAQGDALKTLQGSVQEEGFGKFRMKDTSGASFLLYLSHDKTSFSPDDWRPTVGDQVTASYMEVISRGNAISQAVKVELVKAGPNTLRVKSPVDVEVVETGRTGFKLKVLPSGPVVRFTRQRSTQVIPTGWVPGPGEKARAAFTAQAGKVTFGVSYVLDKLERLDAGGAAK